MSLRDAIRRAEGIARPPAPRFGPHQTAKAEADLSRRWGAVEERPASATIDEVIRRFRFALAGGGGDDGGDGDGRGEGGDRLYEVLTDRDWRMLPWALWQGGPPLAADARLLDAYERRLRNQRRRSEVKALISAYLCEFRPGLTGLDRIAPLLADLSGRWDWPWRDRARDLRLFDPREAPGRVAGFCLDHAEGPRTALTAAGLDRYAHTGLSLQALLAGIVRLEKALASGSAATPVLVERVLAWSLDPDGAVLPGVRGPLADALLRPWLRRQPSPELKDRIQTFLLKHYGDPRVRLGPWQRVSEDARAVFRKWLVKVALDQFLEVIDRLAVEHMWRYRRAFWIAYFRRDWISEAHVMFGSTGYDMARMMFGGDVPCAKLLTATKQVELKHAVLLMRIRRLVIADWSHNGRCAIWFESHSMAPSFNKVAYTSLEVDANSADWETAHRGSDSYKWQRKIRDYIYEKTGLGLADHEFKVRDR